MKRKILTPVKLKRCFPFRHNRLAAMLLEISGARLLDWGPWAMLHDKKSETDGERQKALLRRLVSELNSENPDLYYQPTSEVARLIQDRMKSTLNGDERKLMSRLTQRDIEVLLSLH